jgi:DNA-binding transcriptional MerR regulator
MSKSGETIERLAASLRSLMNLPDVAPSDGFTIGELSTHLGVSLRTLRFYEQSGLLHPTRDGTRRVYSNDDRLRLEVIVGLREFEVSLAGIKSLMTVADGGGPNIEERILALYDQLLGDVAAGNRLRVAELEGINERIDRARHTAVV